MIRVRFAFDDACRLAKFEPPQWIMEYDPLPGSKATESLPRRIILCEEFQTAAGKTVTCWADGAARLRFPTAPPWELAAYFEYDRSTMTHAQMREKFSAWENFFGQQTHRRHWPELGRHIVRLLIVCRSFERIKNLFDTLADSPIANQVRMATEDSLRPEVLFIDPIWLDVKGELRAILKPPVATVKTSASITNGE